MKKLLIFLLITSLFISVSTFSQNIDNIDKQHNLKQYFIDQTKYVEHDGEIILKYYYDPDKQYHPFIYSKLSYTGEHVLTHLRISDNDPSLEYQKAIQEVLGIYIDGKKIYSGDYLDYSRATQDYREFIELYSLEYFFNTDIFKDKSFYLDNKKQSKIDIKLQQIIPKNRQSLIDKSRNMRDNILETRVQEMNKQQFRRFIILDYIYSNLVIDQLLK